ncbi:HDOD domain-containing protein [Thiohalobacter sp. IOR34]|uniref:HDOD domain-containing protein n=1 Tax=Thiohalobacter sp. IOR34 TaxID=3057176 RepID=UPI0025B26534|nr:HDOD domain-containing protein [Thiohalobacter sp. IOR34]WJW76087.1 HDOD domain-containing protein [Thiohalobacter sp. IOR34]
MQLANRLQTFLERHRTRFELRPHTPTRTLYEAAAASGLQQQQLVRGVLLQDGRGLLLAVLPAERLIDFHALQQHFGRSLQPAPPPVVNATFSDCETGSVPPLGEPYGVETVVDETLLQAGEVCFEPGYHNCLACMPGDQFQTLHAASATLAISRSLAVLESRDPRDFLLPGQFERNHPLEALRPAAELRRQIESIERLPAMPEMARRLLRVRNDPNATVRDLTDVIQADPSLTAQIIRYARSALFNFQGKVDTLEQATARVLGFETVLNMALGLAASRTFRNPADGPLGLQAFWQHATYSAALAQTLASAVRGQLAINPGVAYLCGLLHNFGFLLCGHLFRSEFFLLNRLVAANPHVPVTLIEKRLTGAPHTETGSWLMQAWDMPEAVAVACREHHNEAYAGDHALYANLTLLVDTLLRGHGIGEGAEGEPPVMLLNALGLTPSEARTLTAGVLDGRDALDAMARQLAA